MRRLAMLALLAPMLATPALAQGRVVASTWAYSTAGGVTLYGDLYLPLGAGPFHAVVMIHGGGWTQGMRADMRKEADDFAGAGIAVFSIDYRLDCSPSAPPPGVDSSLCGYLYPTPVQDVDAALAWLRAQPLVDGNHVAAVGASAGGNLALEAAFLGATAVVGWSPPGDFTQVTVPAHGAREHYLGCTYSACPGLWVAASPALRSPPGAVPLYLSGSEGDQVVPPSDQQSTVSHWGGPVSYHEVLGSSCHALGCLKGTTIEAESIAFVQQWG